MSNAALARPSYVQEAQKDKAEQRANQELQKFLCTPEGREASLCGSESLGLKKVIQDCKVQWVIYQFSPCTYKKGSMLEKAWYEGVTQRHYDLQEIMERNNL